MNVYGSKSTPSAQEVIKHLIIHLNESGIGSISEIFDGDAPHEARGCIAQAWSVAELLRVIQQYKLYENGAASKKHGKKNKK